MFRLSKRRSAAVVLALLAVTLAPAGAAQAAPTQGSDAAVSVESARAARAANPGPAVKDSVDLGGGADARALAALGPYHLDSVPSGKCAAIQNASKFDNARALLFTCDNSSPLNDYWYFEDLSANDDYYHIVNEHSDRCLTVQNASKNNNALALQFTCDYNTPYNEEWFLVAPSQYNEHRMIVNRHSGLCLTVQNDGRQNNALLLQYGCYISAPYNDEWLLRPV